MFKGTKNAFTLAEVLITLGIIGVVAAMTMPTLMGSTQEAQYKTAFKKNMSVIGQAVSIAVAKNGEDTSLAVGNANVNTAAQTTGSIVNILNEGLNKTNNNLTTMATGHQIDAGTATSVKSGNYNTHFYLQDGTSVHANSSQATCTVSAPCSILIDTNGPKGPNVKNKSGASAGTGTKVKAGYCKALGTAETYKLDPKTGTQVGSMEDSGKVCTATQMISDQFEVLIYDDRVLPRNAVGRYVFYGAK